jgi:hypothetical protein
MAKEKSTKAASASTEKQLLQQIKATQSAVITQLG